MSNNNPIEDLQEIRKLMEDSSKFLSLSGLSGVFAGLIALAGAWLAHYQIQVFGKRALHYSATGEFDDRLYQLDLTLMGIAAGVLVLAIGFGILFTAIKAKKQGQKLVSPLGYRVVRSLLTPLLFGGVFIIGLYINNQFYVIAPAMLIFYGMALLNVSKYLTVEIKYLALCEMALGAYLALFPGMGLILWAVGFGVLHIIYGAIMYFRYDYKKA
ncbi:MAG: hypothetical protein HUJ25_15780 [Crocinitomicaceae bacterium]|nr:hypothetical protein [Crocinitomicaceae bacterium]